MAVVVGRIKKGAYFDSVTLMTLGKKLGALPGVTDAETIGRLVRAIKGPMNVLAGRGTPPTGELERLGVARVSIGGGPMRAALTLTLRIAQELAERGTYTSFTENALPLRDFNRLFER